MLTRHMFGSVAVEWEGGAVEGQPANMKNLVCVEQNNEKNSLANTNET